MLLCLWVVSSVIDGSGSRASAATNKKLGVKTIKLWVSIAGEVPPPARAAWPCCREVPAWFWKSANPKLPAPQAPSSSSRPWRHKCFQFRGQFTLAPSLVSPARAAPPAHSCSISLSPPSAWLWCQTRPSLKQPKPQTFSSAPPLKSSSARPVPPPWPDVSAAQLPQRSHIPSASPRGKVSPGPVHPRPAQVECS